MSTLELRAHQQTAVDAAVAHFHEGRRGQIRHATGSGKTITAIGVAEQGVPGPSAIAVICPSIGLVAQIVDAWRQNATPHRTLAVCSDDSVADSPVHVVDLPCEVSTDPDRIAQWIAQTPGRRLIVGTYRSVGKIGDAVRSLGTELDLLVLDEAHHTAGRLSKESAVVHEDHSLPARRRLYLTATARDSSEGVEDFASAAEAAEPHVGMDDVAVFGPVLDWYGLRRAIDDKRLDDYRIAAIGVTQTEALSALRATGRRDVGADSFVPLRTAAVQVAIARAAELYGVRRVLVFTTRVAESIEFARTMRQTISNLTAGPGAEVTAHHVDGSMSSAERSRYLADLADPPAGGWTVLSSCRCLGEGIDVPAVDAVVFTAPKRSVVDVVQSVGRALRPTPGGTGVSTILLPLLLPGDPTENLDLGECQNMWRILTAMRAHDDELAASLAIKTSSRTGRPDYGVFQLPPQVRVYLPDGWDRNNRFLDHITLRMIDDGSVSWWESYRRLVAYRDARGDVLVPQAYVSPDGYHLGWWVNTQRTRIEHLPQDRVDALNELGMVWAARDDAWDHWFARLEAFVREHGHARVPKDYVTEAGFGLGSWVAAQRRTWDRGTLVSTRFRRLRDVGWAPSEWRIGLDACDRFIAARGHLDVTRSYVDDTGFPLGVWLATQRDRRRPGSRRSRLNGHMIADLDDRGMIWSKALTTRQPTEDERARLLAARARGPRNPEVNRVLSELAERGVEKSALARILGVSKSAISGRLTASVSVGASTRIRTEHRRRDEESS